MRFSGFSLNYTSQVLKLLKLERDEPQGRARVPSIIFTKGGGVWLPELAAAGSDAVGLDWTVNLGQARALIGDRVALQGNLDPMVLMSGPEQVRAETMKVLESFGTPAPGVGHVFNLGHGISQFTPPDNVAVLVETVHSYGKRQRAGNASASSL